jgi:hypothetical protein
MAKMNWIVNLDDCEHRIELEHGHISGKRIIYLDGNVIERINHNFSDAGSNNEFKINEHICVVLIKVVFKFSYDLIIDDISVQTGLPVDINRVNIIYSKKLVDYLPEGFGIFISAFILGYMRSINKPFIMAYLICVFIYISIYLAIKALISWIRKLR